jgi:hypothetical protein
MIIFCENRALLNPILSSIWLFCFKCAISVFAESKFLRFNYYLGCVYLPFKISKIFRVFAESKTALFFLIGTGLFVKNNMIIFCENRALLNPILSSIWLFCFKSAISVFAESKFLRFNYCLGCVYLPFKVSKIFRVFAESKTALFFLIGVFSLNF